MKPIERNEVLGIREYEPVRERFRAHVIEKKKPRRILVGPIVTVVFENRATVLLQIEEMLRTEHITREEAILHELETYNELIPGPNELSCTLMIAINDETERKAFLVAARGLERHIAIEVEGERSPAKFLPTRELEDQTSAVHYLKFALSPKAADAIRKGDPKVEFKIDHAVYQASFILGENTVASLREDLTAE